MRPVVDHVPYDQTNQQFDLVAPDHGGTPSHSQPFRPIQYLGNKLRALHDICEATVELVPRGGRVVDLFAGTTVVSQALAARGHRVTAVDTQRYSEVFASAMLGLSRTPGETFDVRPVAHLAREMLDSRFSDWRELAIAEQAAVQRGDVDALQTILSEAPLLWRDAANPLHANLRGMGSKSAVGQIPLVTSIYGGSYFGFTQALTLDLLRQASGHLLGAGKITSWQYSVALTAILSAASAAAHSAGKHFAQPLNAGRQENKKFLSKRLLEDRRISIGAQFSAAIARINAGAFDGANGHSVSRTPAEEFVEGQRDVGLYYLDPPYTAQQYSRFYHLLETICTYEYPQLFTGGELTTGLYPSERYKSAFSSKRAASAFGHIIETSKQQGAALLISYSNSATNSNGNARMISLETLMGLCQAHYGKRRVGIRTLGHRYRQFNSASLSNQQRDDPEILITCRPR